MGACIGIRFRDLIGACTVHLGLDLSQFVGFLLEPHYLVDDTLNLRVTHWHPGRRKHVVGAIEFRQITLNALVDFPEALAQLLTCEILGLGVHGLELAAVDGNAVAVEQVDIAAQRNKLPAHYPYGNRQSF